MFIYLNCTSYTENLFTENVNIPIVPNRNEKPSYYNFYFQ